MKNIFKTFLAITILTAVFTGCKKYEDGPMFSLRTKKARLCGDWKIKSYTVNGTDQTAAFNTLFGANFEWDIEKDETYKIKGNFTDDGKWSLGEDKDDVRFVSNAPGAKENSFRILRLKNKELWWKQTQANGDVEEYKFVPVD